MKVGTLSGILDDVVAQTGRTRENVLQVLESENQTMPRYDVPQNIGKVRVAMGVGGKFTVWNGKQGKHEFAIPCRNRKQAEEIARLLNSKNRPKEIEVAL